MPAGAPDCGPDGWTALKSEYSDRLLVVQAAHQIDHLERHHCGIGALVAGLAAREIYCLFRIGGRQYPKGDRHAGLERDSRNAARAFACDIVKMRRLPANHAP